MAESDTLLAYLVPKYARSSEDAATDALVYLLNKSDSAIDAFNSFLKNAVGEMEGCIHFNAQVSEDGSRFDFVGYDYDRANRVIGESKFWAGLGLGQGGVYFDQLASDGAAVLLFVVPEARVNYLWPQVVKDVAETSRYLNGQSLTLLDSRTGFRKAKASEIDKYVIMVSWRDLLNDIFVHSSADPRTLSDVRQLQGLAERMDSDAFQPIHPEELGPSFARRTSHYPRLINDAVDRGVREGWLDIGRLRITPQEYGYGRYVRMSGLDTWFGVNIYQWGANSDTPLWLNVFRDLGTKLEHLAEDVNLSLYEDWAGTWIPISLRTNVERDQVLDYVVFQLKAIAAIVEEVVS